MKDCDFALVGGEVVGEAVHGVEEVGSAVVGVVGDDDFVVHGGNPFLYLVPLLYHMAPRLSSHNGGQATLSFCEVDCPGKTLNKYFIKRKGRV